METRDTAPSVTLKSLSCFQFVKRMNGNNSRINPQINPDASLLPIREAYEWKRRKNADRESDQTLLPIREAYEWKQSWRQDWDRFLTDRLASNS